MNVRRLVVILIVAGVVAGVVILAGGESGAAGGVSGVLRRPENQAAAPAFASNETAPPARADVRELTPAAADANAAPPAADSDLRITMLHSDGVPAAGCLIVVAPTQGNPWSATTDDAGSAAGPAVESEGLVWIDGPLLAPASYALSIRRGALTLRLPAGEVLEGRALVDGAPPRAPFALELAPRAESTDLPGAVRALLARPELGEAAIWNRAGLLVREDGAFRFSGLPSGWTGRFALPGTMMAGEGEDLAALAGDRARTLRLHRVPRIFVRFLLPTGEPAAGAHVDATTRAASGSNGYQLTADDDGRSNFPLNPWEPIQTVDLTAVDAAGNARLDLSRPVPDPTHDFDLGDLRLDPAWTVRFRALDLQGAPIAGALGGTECPKLAQSEPTGADGLGSVSGVQPGCAELRVGAARHEIASVALPAQLPAAPIDVTLRSCAHLAVHVVPGDGRPRPGLMIHFQTVTHAARWTHDSAFSHAAYELGTTPAPWASYTSRRGGDGNNTLEMGRDYVVPESGDVIVGCVEPGDPLQVALVDCTRHVLWSREHLTLQPAEQSEVTIPVSAVPATLDVLVTDAAGAPVPGAQVKLVDAERPDTENSAQELSLKTDAAGRTQFRDLYAPSVDLECSHSGFATVRLADLPAAGVAHVVLAAGLSVTVHFVDAQGRPVPVPTAGVARVDGQRLVQVKRCGDDDPDNPLPPGDWTFDDLPDVPLRVFTRISGRQILQPLDPHAGEVRFVVPDTGSLLVRGLPHEDGGGSVRLLVDSLTVETDHLAVWLDTSDPSDASAILPVLLAGRYRITLVADGTDDAAEHPLRGPLEVEVRAGQQTTVDLP